MNQNGEIVIILSASLDDLREAGWAVGGGLVSGEDATSVEAPGISATEAGGNVVIVDPVMETGVYAAAIAASLQRQVLAATFGSDGDIWIWRAETEQGARELAWIGGDLGHESGEPHPAEEGLGHLDEQVLWTLLERAASLSEDTVLAAEYRPIELPEAVTNAVE